MTPVSPGRRERLRAATVAEIKLVARRLLVAGGPNAISVRAIAREMGLTAPAIYRYFPSLDALVADLAGDLYRELHQVVDQARLRVPEKDPRERLRAIARAFRAWAVGHRPEFCLIFGEHAPHLPEKPGEPAYDLVVSMFAEYEALSRHHRLRTPPDVDLLTAHLTPPMAAACRDLPVSVVYAFLAGWTWLYGVVAMEVFGHLSWAAVDPEPLFELAMSSFLHNLTD